jgi:RNA polymerase sigma factor (TIGR02999 family)
MTGPDSNPSRDELFAQAYDRLKRIGRRSRGREDGDTCCTTALVHELYVQMARGEARRFDHEWEFFGYAAQAIRHLLVDAARRRATLRAGVGARVDMEAALDVGEAQDLDSVLLLDQALQQLEAVDERAAGVVKLHYFAGLSLQQVAQAYGLSSRTVERDWRFARAFLRGALRS